MPDNFTTLATQIWSTVQSSSRVLLHLHPSPDPDSVGGALAMGLWLRDLGKQVTILAGDSPLNQSYSALPGFDLIQPLTVFQVDLSAFVLFIIQDSTSLPRVSALGPITFPSSLHTLIIDHHSANTRFAEINLVDGQAPATCQLLYHLFSVWSVTLTPEIAVNLFAGLYSDTLGFSAPDTTSDTLAIAARLAEINPGFSKILSDLENAQPPAAIYFLGLVLSSVKTYFSGQVAISLVTADQMSAKNIAYPDTENSSAVDLLRSCRDWLIVCVVRETQPGIFRVSFRSKDPRIYDVSLAAAALGGSGHPYAAGATLTLSQSDTLAKIVDSLVSLYPTLGQI